MFSSIAGGTTGFGATTAGYIAGCVTATGTTIAAALAVTSAATSADCDDGGCSVDRKRQAGSSN